MPSSECCKLLPLSQRWVGRASGSPLPTLVTFPPRVGCPHCRQARASLAFSAQVRQCPFRPLPASPRLPCSSPPPPPQQQDSSYPDPPASELLPNPPIFWDHLPPHAELGAWISAPGWKHDRSKFPGVGQPRHLPCGPCRPIPTGSLGGLWPQRPSATLL